ncbi:PglD-related sugar-binding protein [Parapedobacter tibetensis]|uniref:PglD-related sugar-binding protein n=1 Tax=Parapedobacter tibetensis TaxID=2972951 RepID=UPI00214DB421|nr:transferase [Parapedobacter tibetensis]
MKSNKFVIYGAGGHARVLLEGLERYLGSGAVIGFFNDGDGPSTLAGIPVGPYQTELHPYARVLLGIGLPHLRKQVAAKVSHSFGTFIHPTATVAADVTIGEGTVVLAGAVIQTGAKIGNHVIINANVTIDHDAMLEDYVTTYPGVYVGAHAVIGEGCLLNPNVVMMRNIRTDEFVEIPAQGILWK